MTCYQPPPPAPPAMLYRLAYAVLGVAMLNDSLAGIVISLLGGFKSVISSAEIVSQFNFDIHV